MQPLAFRFVPSLGVGSPKEYRRIDSENRAHVARVVQQRRRQQRKKAGWVPRRRHFKNQYTQRFEIILRGHGSDPAHHVRAKAADLGDGTRHSLVSMLRPIVYLPIKQGCCDPFSSFPVAITPQVNQVLTFMREVYFPMVYDRQKLLIQNDRKLPSIAGLGAHAWETVVSHLSAEGIALACVASFLGNIAGLMGEPGKSNATRLAMAFSKRSSILLRQSLQASVQPDGSPFPKAIVIQIYFLHRASITAEDRHLASIYGAMLSSAMTTSALAGTVDWGLLFPAGLDDIDGAVKFMRRTSFDYAWLARTCTDLWANAGRYLVPEPQIFNDLHWQVQCPILREAFLVSRSLNAYAEGALSRSDQLTEVAPAKLIFFITATQSVWATGTAMNLFFDLRDGICLCQDSTQLERLTQAALALVLAFQLRSMVFSVKINERDIRDYTAIMLPELRHTMTTVFDLSTDEDLAYYRDAHLWILFMAAYWEQRNSNTAGWASHWFQRHLLITASLARKTTWTALLPILKSFVFAEWDAPGACTWFENAISTMPPVPF
jgi:hypothetical protein